MTLRNEGRHATRKSGFVENTATIARVCYWLGVLLILFAVADSVLFWAWRINLTGVQWSPLVAGGVGILLMNLARMAFRPANGND